MTLRQDKLNMMFKKLITQFLQRNLGVALVSVTDFKISKDMHTARAYVAFYPEKNAEEIHSLIESKQKDLRNFLKKNTRVKILPQITFNIDKGEENRQKIDKLLSGS